MSQELTSTVEKKSCPVCRKEFLPEQSVCPEHSILLVEKDPLIGAVFEDRYEITEFIGQGGMSLVYKAWQAQLNRNVAIKLLKSQQMSDATNVKRFLREAQAAATLQHPNLNAIYSVGVTDSGQPFLVLEYLEGKSLARLLDAEKPLPVKRAARIFSQIAAALEHAHAQGIIHRDLKPSNIVIAREDDGTEVVKVVDFGLVKILDAETEPAQRLTQGGEVLGTVMYMSPEQRRGEEVDARSDLYSVGRMLYDAVETAGELPEQLKPIVNRALEEKPENRYPNATELKSALDALLQGDKQPNAKRPSLWHRFKSNRMLVGVVLSVVAVFSLSLIVLLSPARLPVLHWFTWSVLTMRGADPEKLAIESLHYASRQAHSGDFAGAVRTYENELMPLCPKVNPVTQARILSGLGLLYCQRGDYAMGRTLCEEINKVIDHNASIEPQYLRTMAMAQTDLAVQVALNEPHSASRVKRLLILGERNMKYHRYREAEAIFKELMPNLDDKQFDQYRCEYLEKFADLYAFMRKDKERDAICDLALQKIGFDPKYSVEQASLVWLQIGVSLFQRGEVDKAQAFLEKALARLQPDKGRIAMVYAELGNVYRAQGKKEVARQAFLNALKHPKDFKTPEMFMSVQQGLASLDKDIDAAKK